MTCKICDWLQSWLGARVEIDCNRIWDNIHDWESAHSNDGELWAPEADRNRELFDQASAIQDSDPESAFHMYMRAAVAGSPWAMRTVAWHYHWGSFVSVDHALAQDYYHRAICAGSWMATLPYARLLADEGRFEDAETVLQDGIGSDFVPAYFWLARLRLKRSRSRRTCREIRPLLEYSSDRGHPGAKRLLAALTLLGKYGFRQIPTGFRTMRMCMEKDEVEGQAGAGTSAPS